MRRVELAIVILILVACALYIGKTMLDDAREHNIEWSQQ